MTRGLALAFLVAACAPQRATIEPGVSTEPTREPELRAAELVAEPDRSTRPLPGPTPALTLPAMERFALDNGLEVIVVEKHDLPLVQANLIVRAGSVHDVAGRLGLATLTADMLDEGAAGRSALDIADAFEFLGARFGVGAGLHSAQVTLRVPLARLQPALALAADVVLRPDFPPAELERLRAERLTALIRAHDQPNVIADVLGQQTVFGARHPYGRSAREADTRAITRADVQQFWRQHWAPNNATLVVAGDIDAARARALAQSAFGDWERADVAPAQVTAAPQVQGRTIHLVDKPGAAQSVIFIGRVGAARSSADYYALEVMNALLGGMFTSRINQNLRETHGYSYGAFSRFDFRPVPGPWSAAASVQTAVTGPALREFFNELEGIHAPIPAEEVERAKNFLALRFPAQFQSVAGIAGGVGETVLHGLPLSTLDETVERIMAVTVADVERVARAYIDPANVAVIVVGDREAIEAQVREQDLGALRLLTVTDVLGAVPAM